MDARLGFLCAIAGAVAGCGTTPLLVEARTWTFEADPVKGVPAGFIVPEAPTGGPAGQWEVEDDDTAPSLTHVLRQVATAREGSHWNICVADTPEVADFTCSVQLRAHPEAKPEDNPEDKGGPPEDRGGGLAFRYRDVRNTYVVRWNPLEANLRLYHVIDGKRTQLASTTVPGKPDDAQWWLLTVEAAGPDLVARLRLADPTKAGETAEVRARDTAFARGRVACWTKADASTSFDDLAVSPLAPR